MVMRSIHTRCGARTSGDGLLTALTLLLAGLGGAAPSAQALGAGPVAAAPVRALSAQAEISSKRLRQPRSYASRTMSDYWRQYFVSIGLTFCRLPGRSVPRELGPQRRPGEAPSGGHRGPAAEPRRSCRPARDPVVRLGAQGTAQQRISSFASGYNWSLQAC
jgi:hypothetical protein